MRCASTLLFLAWLCIPGLALAAAPKLELKPCADVPDAPQEARCGTYEVWENRTAKSGRKIPLRVLVLPAKGPDRQPDPFVFFNGGPGDSNVEAASWLAGEVGEILKKRDLLLVDFRGSGGSGGLFCPEMESSAGLQGYLDHFIAPDQVKACYKRLAKTADLSQYTNDTSVDDIDEVRAALGYEKLNLIGGSGGSRTVLVYLRRHPDKVRTAILSGLVPTDERGPFPMARHAQRALDGLFAACDRDEACRAAFPRFRDELAAVLQRSAKEPAAITLTDGETGKPVEVRLTRNALITTVRVMLYRPASAARLPFTIHQAALGNWRPMAEAAQAAGAGTSTWARGYYLSLTCSEDVPFIPEDEIPAAVQGSFLGDFRIRAQQAACAEWPVPPVGREFQEPVTSDVPSLLISGELDPVTPPGNAERALRTLKNSLHVVVPHAGHNYDGLEGIDCLTDLMTRFVEAGTVTGLDGSCLAKAKRPAFALAEEPAAKLALKPCATIPGLPPDARCGTYEVWENRAAKAGRKIPLRVVVLPATGPGRLSDPFTFFNGGPGASNVEEAAAFALTSGEVRKRRDLLFVDFRGTGGSAPLSCPEMEGNTGFQSVLDQNMAPDKARACAERLAKTADLSQYTNDTTVDDIDEVRAALGYDKLNIYAGSAGTRAAQVYLRRHPDSVRTMTIFGVLPMDERGPFPMARHVQRALDGLIAECREDAGCRKAFPRLREEVDEVLRRAGKEPAVVALTDIETGKPVAVRLTRNGVAQTLRYMLYRPLGAAMLPLSVHLAARGDWKLMAEAARYYTSSGLGSLSRGYYLSLTCAEDLPFVPEDEIPAAVQGSFLGDFRIRAQQAACAAWPVPPVGREFLEPVTSDVPVLLLSGERDPVTPPGNAEKVARTLKNSLHVVMPDGAHGDAGIEGAFECTNGLLSRFIEAGTLKGLDTSCVARTKRPEFVLQLDPQVELPAAQLARLAGTYKDPENGYEIRIETAGNLLRVREGEYPPMGLVATSPTRFRVQGMPTGYVFDFQIVEGRVVSLTTAYPGWPLQTLRREDAPAASSKLELKPCAGIPGLPQDARCGTYEVWENREAKSGRKIPLRVVVIPATGPDRLPDPFTYFNGGPGVSSVGAAPSIAAEFAALRKRRDILLVDFRGTGGSGGLFCPEMTGGAGAQGFLDEFYPPEKVRTCAERLAKTADFSQYTNAASVDDIEEVRAALGYGKLNIYGASGGSKSALVYLRRHPDSVRTVILHGVAPTDERGPFPMARHAQRALDSLIAECEGDPACRAAFPRLRDEAAAVLRQVEKQPVTVTLTDGETGKPVDVRLTRNGVATTLRYMLYSQAGASLLPLSVHFAARGDWKPMAEAARRFSAGSGGALADGYYLSLTCAEDLPFIREEEIPAAVQGTFLGDFRIRRQQAACAAWPVPAVGRDFLDPTVSAVPALLLSGERDPVTPPSNAERAARTLKNSLRVVVPDAGHSFGAAYQCVDSLIVRFVEAGTATGLDTSCVARTKRPEFVLHRDPDVELPAGQLARFAGTYKDAESGYEVRVQAAGNRLLAVLVGEESNMVLVPTSPSRFRVEGMTDTMTFQLPAGQATLLWEAPGVPSLTLKREG